MILDTSALLAVLFDEPEAGRFARLIGRAERPRISAGSYLETAIVVEAQTGARGGHRLDALMRDAGIAVEPFTPEQAEMARAAYRDYGRGSGHAAGLNFGDCFAYALAKASDEPLLFKGRDFARTDVEAVLPPIGPD
ncbi:MAG TPA: type II toxin-antitoxin system VapC family toxin [Terriglobales bacterium]|nr:type II toxin-antitoxin system VapC family toxin [Terriglobales bacterium]